MSFSTLLRTLTLLVAVFFTAMTWLYVANSGRTASVVRNFMEQQGETAALLQETGESLLQARQLYSYIATDRSPQVGDPVGVADTVIRRLETFDMASKPGFRSLVHSLHSLRAGLLRIDEMREADEFSDVMTSLVEEVKRHLADAVTRGEMAAASGDLPEDLSTFLDNAMKSLSRACGAYLRARPDRLPVLESLLAKIQADLESLSALVHPDLDKAALATLSDDVHAIRVNAPRLRSHNNDPNFQNYTNKPLGDELKRRWDSATLAIQHLRADHAARLRHEAERHVTDIGAGIASFHVLSVLALVLALTALLAARWVFNRRIREIKHGASLLSAGQLTHRIPVTGRDVFGELATEFNALASGLQAEQARAQRAMEALSRSHGQLDERVRERTLELSQALDSLRLMDSIFTNSTQGIIICDEKGHIVDANPAASRITGHPLQDIVGKTPESFCSEAEVNRVKPPLEEALRLQGRFETEVTLLACDGRGIPVHFSMAILGGESSGQQFTIGIFQDLTSQREAERRLARQAMRDPLTGLANRALLFQEASRRMATLPADRPVLAMILLDLDNFKTLNDSLGHAEGDRLLREVAARLVAAVDDSALVARLGGDEFAVLSPPLADERQALEVAKRLHQCFVTPFETAWGIYRANSSLGMAVHPNDGDTPDELFKNADMALNRAKSHGKGLVEVYTRKLAEQVLARAALERDIHAAVAGREFEVHYQPIVAVDEPLIVGAEALLRWRRGAELIPPQVFIPMSEEMNFIQDITHILLEIVAADLDGWRGKGLTPHVSVNISAVQFSDPAFHERISQILSLRGVPCDQVGLEITETAIMNKPEQAAATLLHLRGQGHTVSIDDFGTGYSSLRNLQRFPLTTLKIDRQFISGLGSKETRAIVKASIAMAKGLGLSVVAEGVEKPEELEFLRACRCDSFQGYLFSPAVPAEEFLGMLQRQQDGTLLRGKAFPSTNLLH